MTDATRGLVRYELDDDVDMVEHRFGDWVRYEDAACMAKLLARGGPGGDLGRFVPAECFAPGELVIPGWRAYELVEELDAAKAAAESLERLLERERADHSRAMSDAAVERIRPSCSEEGGSCHAMMHSMCRRMNAMERDAARIQRARAKLFVRCLEMMAEARVAALEYGGDSFRRRNEQWTKMWIRLAREERRIHRLARHITAKYLGEGT